MVKLLYTRLVKYIKKKKNYEVRRRRRKNEKDL